MHTDKPFRVDITVCVDRPELRDATYTIVRPGHRVIVSYWHATQGAAVREFNAILGGMWDYPSEYAAAVSVVHVTPGRQVSPTMYLAQRVRTVRRRVERDRQQTEDTQTWRRRCLQVSAARRGNLLCWRFPPVVASWPEDAPGLPCGESDGEVATLAQWAAPMRCKRAQDAPGDSYRIQHVA